MKFYEKDIIEYVASQQIKSNKTVKRLIMRDHAKEKEDPNRYAREAGAKLASSSFLGRNPFGDLPMDPALMYDEEESSDASEATEKEPREKERLARAGAAGDVAAEGSAAEGAETERVTGEGTSDVATREKLLTTEGSLLKTIQDRCHMYARVHLPRILSKSLAEKISIMEMEDRADPTPLQIYRNKRRPWQHFRNLILEDLPKASGLHEVNTLLSMTSEDNDTADRWAQRYHVGRRVIGKRMGTNLSDAIYVELCLRGN